MQTVVEAHHLLSLLSNEPSSQECQRRLKIVFTSMNKAPSSKPDIIKNSKAYIPQSLFFDFESRFVNKCSALEHMMPPSTLFEQEAAKLDLQVDDEIVVYDDFGNFCASRVWFMLMSMGYQNVKVLQGGLPAWLKLAYPTQETLWDPEPSLESADLRVNEFLKFVDCDFLLSIINMQSGFESMQIVDARSIGRFEGREAEPRPNMRSGHIPGALSLHYAQLQKEGCFKTHDVLRKIVAKAGIDLNLPIVTSCGSGVTACILAQAFYELGCREIYVYDGSWSEWGASDSLPIENVGKEK